MTYTKQIALLICLCGITTANAQLHPLTYYSQLSFGANWANFTIGIMVGRINNDTLPDVVMTGAQTYHLGFGEMQNGKLHFAMRPQQFIRDREYLFKGQLVDFDNDGDLDFQSGMHTLPYQYATYIFENQDGMLSNSFYRPSLPLPDSTVLTFGHFNSDSIMDVFYYREPPQSSPGYHLKNGATGLDMPLGFDYLSGLIPNDYNKDGLMDFLQVHPNSPALGTQAHRLYLNRGDFTFDKFETRTLVYADALGDFDGDGVLDLLDFVGGNGLNYSIKSSLKSADSALVSPVFVSPKLIEQLPVTIDLNDDGFDDFLVFTRDSTFFCKNNGNLTFEIFPIDEVAKVAAHRQHPDLPKGTLLGLSYDGTPVRLELVFSDSTGFSMQVDYNAFSPFVIPEPIYFFQTATIDGDNDGLPELCIASESNIFCAEMQADSTIGSYNVVRGFKYDDIRSMTSADWNLDGHNDLLYSDGTSIQVRLRQADSTFSVPIFVTDGLLFEVLDFDNNGYLDLLLDLGYDSTLVLLFENDSIIHSQTLYTGFTPQSVMAFDPNGDGFPDIAMSSGNVTNGKTSVFMNNGQGHFSKTQSNIPGTLALHEYIKSPYIFLVHTDEQTPDFDFLAELYKVSPNGNSIQLINSQLFVDTLINFREAWMTLYGNDSIPDLLFNYGSSVKAVLIDDIGNAETHTFNNVSIAAIEDMTGDGFAEVVWIKGSQIFVENVEPPTPSGTDEALQPLGFQVFPNPVSGGALLEIVLENDFSGAVKIEVLALDGRVLSTSERFKNLPIFNATIQTSGFPNTFIVRVLDGKSTGSRLVFKF